MAKKCGNGGDIYDSFTGNLLQKRGKTEMAIGVQAIKKVSYFLTNKIALGRSRPGPTL